MVDVKEAPMHGKVKRSIEVKENRWQIQSPIYSF